MSKAKYKARALDYSCKVRESLGISSKDVKILFLDDDTIPSKKYIRGICYETDYEVMQGILKPRIELWYYIHMLNMRTLACLSVCSIYQSHGHPVWVHRKASASEPRLNRRWVGVSILFPLRI